MWLHAVGTLKQLDLLRGRLHVRFSHCVYRMALLFTLHKSLGATFEFTHLATLGGYHGVLVLPMVVVPCRELARSMRLPMEFKLFLLRLFFLTNSRFDCLLDKVPA